MLIRRALQTHHRLGEHCQMKARDREHVEDPTLAEGQSQLPGKAVGTAKGHALQNPGGVLVQIGGSSGLHAGFERVHLSAQGILEPGDGEQAALDSPDGQNRPAEGVQSGELGLQGVGKPHCLVELIGLIRRRRHRQDNRLGQILPPGTVDAGGFNLVPVFSGLGFGLGDDDTLHRTGQAV